MTALTAVVDGIPAELPELQTTLPDGRIGYFQTSNDQEAGGCLAAAVATATQTPLEEVGKVGTLRELEAWADARGLRVEMHLEGPPADDRLWIGLSAWTHNGLRHTIVGQFNDTYFDPASGWVFPGGAHCPPTRELEYAISLQPKESTQ